MSVRVWPSDFARTRQQDVCGSFAYVGEPCGATSIVVPELFAPSNSSAVTRRSWSICVKTSDALPMRIVRIAPGTCWYAALTRAASASPCASIYSCEADGVEGVAYEDAEPVRLTQSFLEARQRFLHELFSN